MLSDFWTDPDLLDARHRKSAAVLVAVSQALERHRPLGGREAEFLELYRRIATVDPAVFTRIWMEPRAYLWLRLAYQLVGACVRGGSVSTFAERANAERGATDPQEALALHLDAFKEFCVAVACTTGETWRFATPLRATLPFTVAAVRWTIEGEGAIEVHGVRAGRLEATIDGRPHEVPLDRLNGAAIPVGSAKLHPAVVASHAGCELVMEPAAFNLAGLDIRDAVLAAGRPFQLEYRQLMEDAVAALARYVPEQFACFRDDMRHAAVKRIKEGPFTNVSYSELPGACVTSPGRNALVLADRLLHEYQHNRLFALEERGVFFEPGSGSATDCRHYSPWRDDPRPPQGLLHAVTVYVSSCRLWLRVYTAGVASQDELAFARDRLIRIPLQLALAMDVLEREARFAEHGRTVFTLLRSEIAELESEIANVSLPGDVPALSGMDSAGFAPLLSEEHGRPISAREAVAEHVRLCDRLGQCPESARVAS